MATERFYTVDPLIPVTALVLSQIHYFVEEKPRHFPRAHMSTKHEQAENKTKHTDQPQTLILFPALLHEVSLLTTKAEEYKRSSK